jgi:hypothetical protein
VRRKNTINVYITIRVMKIYRNTKKTEETHKKNYEQSKELGIRRIVS